MPDSYDANMAARKARTRRAPAGPRLRTGGLEFNHAMIYTRSLDRSLPFYRDLLGFRVVDEYPGVYARLCSPKGRTTIALHCLEPGMTLPERGQGMRLYFEVAELDALCKDLRRRGVSFEQLPQDMPWGWRHAYLRDPDGHELSLYRAGAARLRRTVMREPDHA